MHFDRKILRIESEGFLEVLLNEEANRALSHSPLEMMNSKTLTF